METLTITIKKPFARQVLVDLQKLEAISIVETKKKIDPDALWGSWQKRPVEEIDEHLRKMRDEWERPI